jgi:capsid portal protein
MQEIEKLYTLIPLEDFKAILGIDYRDDKTAKFCLVTSTLTIDNTVSENFYIKNILKNRIFGKFICSSA